MAGSLSTGAPSVSLLVASISGPEIFRGSPIAYRVGTNEIGTYQYSRWIEPPVETAKLAEACGVEHIALHGRTKEQGYRGLANWDLVKQIKEVVKVPVSGSGDITTIQQAFDRFRETGCDGVLIGRGAMANPWIFRQIEDAMHGRERFQPTLDDKRAVLLEYFDMLREDMPELPAIGRMKQLAGQFTRGLQGGALFRTALYHSHSVTEILDRISEYFETISAGRQYFGEAGPPRATIGAPVLDSCGAMVETPVWDSCEAMIEAPALDSCEAMTESPASDSCEAASV
jgi:hypothetical protein